MKKFEIVKTNREFNEIIQNGKKIKNNYFNIYIRKNNYLYSRFGIAVGKKLGNAVDRNKFKRRIRNILTNQKKMFSKEYDYIIIMKEKAAKASYKDLEIMLVNLLLKGE